MLALATLAGVIGPANLTLPIGPAGTALHLALDPLAASFLLLAPCAAFAPLPLAASAVILVAADGFTLLVGLALLGAATALRPAICATACLLVALALAGSAADFAAIRAAPPEGWRAIAVLVLAIGGAAAASRISTTVAAYLLIRVLVDLCGNVQPLWWGVPLLLMGAAIAMAGSLRAALAETLHAAVSLASLQPFGLAAMGLGAALFARAVDLPSAASRALDAVWLALVCHVLCRTLLQLCADALENGAGSRRLDRLGGLIHRLPWTAGCCLAGLFALATLPPGLGFAALWLLVQSLLATARAGDFGVQVLVAVVVVPAGLSIGLAAFGAVRLFGVVFLGRPRTPRTAVADEAPRPVRVTVATLAGLGALLGLLPAVALWPAAGWTGSAIALVELRTGAETLGYLPIAVAAILFIAGVLVWRGVRRAGEQRREPVWSGGFAAPPPWLPFGDPVTQYGSVSFAEPLRRAMDRLQVHAGVWARLVHWWQAALRAAVARVVP